MSESNGCRTLAFSQRRRCNPTGNRFYLQEQKLCYIIQAEAFEKTKQKQNKYIFIFLVSIHIIYILVKYAYVNKEQ